MENQNYEVILHGILLEDAYLSTWKDEEGVKHSQRTGFINPKQAKPWFLISAAKAFG